MSDYTPSRQELVAAWIQAHQVEGWGGPVDMESAPKTRIAEAHRGFAEVERAAAEKALTDLAAKIEATARRTDNTFTEHAVVEAGGLELLREAAEAYRQERREQ